MNSTKTVAIIGAGFAGLSALLTLRKAKNVKILLFDKDSSFEYTPSLHLGLHKNTDMKRIQIPLKKHYKEYFIHEQVLTVEHHKVITPKKTYHTDYIIIASGSRTHFFGNKSFERFGQPLRRASDLTAIHKKIGSTKQIVVVGGGYTGVEVASVLAELPDKKVTLIHSQERILDQLGESISRKASSYLARHHINLILGERVATIGKNNVALASGKKMPSDLTLLTSGIKANDEIFHPDAKVNQYYCSLDASHILLCGDVVKTDLIPTAHNAMIEGRIAGACLLHMLKGKGFPSVSHKETPLLVALGSRDGIVSFGKWGFRFPFTGFLKWLVEKRILFEFRYKIQLPL